MQSWQDLAGQPATDGQQNPNINHSDPQSLVWQQGYAFPQGDEHFDPNQDWSQAVAGQVPFQHHVDTHDAANFFDSHAQHPQDSAFFSSESHPQQASYQGAPDGLNFSQQFQSRPEVIDPNFNHIHPDLYAQQGKVGISPSQGQSEPERQALQQRDFNPQYAQAQVLPHQPQSQTQQVDQQQFSHTQQPQQQPLTYQGLPRQSPVQLQQSYQNPSAYAPPQSNGNGPSQAAHFGIQQQQQPEYSQAQFAPAQAVQYQQHVGHEPRLPPVQQPQVPGGHAIIPQTAGAATQSPQVQHLDSPAGQSAPIDVLPKKRKRTLKTSQSNSASDVISFQVEPHIDNSTSKLAEIDSLPPPAPTPEEADLIAKFNKRTKAAKAKFPAIKGLPHLVQSGTVTLPTPKSFDKLAPLVALPPRSGKSVVPELGYPLPCQIQGRFSSQYQPSAEKTGLEQRKDEAYALLDEYNRSMKAIGKRQPKYTEYPHAFKEQLKADEANKNKAGKKAKQEGQSNQRNKPIRSDVRPTDPVEAVAWDAIGIVHIEPSVTRSSTLIATRVQQTGDFFIKLRGEMNHAKQNLDQAISDKVSADELAACTGEYELRKKALYQALDAVIEHADDAVLDNLGGHQKLISSLVNVLISCIKAGDLSGKLPKVALELFTQMPMTKKIAETTNFETVRKRFAEKGDEEARALAREIAVNVKKALKPAETDSTGGYAGTSGANRAKVAGSKPTDGTAAKRGRDDDGASDGRSVKKVIVEAGSSSLSKKLAATKATTPSVTKATSTKPTASSTLAGKLRPATKSVTKPSEVTTSDNTVSAVEDKVKAELKKSASKPASSSSSALSGIGSLLASINTPKPETAPVTKDTKGPDSNETSEERTKRLRKEARRKLRVSWKPEGELVKVKIFEKEESEDEGRAHNLTKDAGDDRSEGMMLKQRADMDEDDEEDDIPYQPWEAPSPASWTALPEETRNKNFITRGGNVGFSTDEQKRIRERESRELMVFYQDVNDIPTSPKSPPPEAATVDQRTATNLPIDGKFQEIHKRWTDEDQMGPDGALYSAIRRLDAQKNPTNKLDTILGRLQGAAANSQSDGPVQQNVPSLPSDAPLVLGAPAAEQVLAWLRSDKVLGWRSSDTKPQDLGAYHYTDPDVRQAGTTIEALVRYLSSKPYPATSPPDWLLNDEERVREWWLGYNKEAAARQKKAEDEQARAQAEANAFLAAATTAQQGQQATGQDWAAWLAQAQQQPQQQPQHQALPQADYMAIIQQMAAAQQPAQAAAQGNSLGNDQLQSILAAINQQGQQPQASAVPNAEDDPVQRYLAQLAQASQQPQTGSVPPPPPPQDYGREREWDRGGDDDDREWERDRDYKDGGKGKRTRTLPPHKPINKALIGTKPCTFWQQGKCARGDQCTFRHD
ncbi:C-x8-C-x5-C-x3-H type zinc finger protein [Sarocladium implicatum]|nr:C-x8-C-x5-C-x3-H type zinc finger protein [Sarocladium implicatum]